ncbi:DEAD/DEAH box helicase family protein [Pseudodesulfovibrio tunisiensis]|uniref:DEAD/DEAH box helicase family protein n=1 Tax=Pseudodesulfovibrio tunisiensis TaxID=463192 RepID=UPI001FB394D7|nr:DEAD/DEAH box helicase family protein [Pseudodesulfovibrio tunisiensis]
MFDKVSIRKAGKKTAVDPLEIFNGLTLRGTVENIWAPQNEALVEWSKQRENDDIIVEMNTGGGKTLVGLLIAQSIINEHREKVLYLCPTIQLVEQAAKRASECGLLVSTYVNSSWTNREHFDRCDGPCITTYAALFNGFSIFNREEIRGYVFDDGHVVEGILRDCFTLKFKHGSDAFDEIITLFQPFFEDSYQSEIVNDVRSGKYEAMLYLPQFELRREKEKLLEILRRNNVADDDNKFAWNHIKDDLVRCCLIIDGSGIEITPPCLPTHRLNVFAAESKRVYLTATLPIKTDFIRTFGIEAPTSITPSGKSGDAQRLFVFPEGEEDEKQREEAENLIEDKKGCIIVPSYKAAEEWNHIGEIFDKNCDEEFLESFRGRDDNSKLILVARYDGVDLPGDSCRILILCRTPSSSHHFDKFLENKLQVSVLRSSKTAIRIIQAIGRIFRSNTDHGVVVVTGNELRRWLSTPKNIVHFPSLLQKQIKLGEELKRNVALGNIAYDDLVEGVLSGNPEWDNFYSENITQMETEPDQFLPSWISEILLREKRAFQKLWESDYQAALRLFSKLCEETQRQDIRLASWYRHWLGFVYEELDDHISAFREYRKAANTRAALGLPKNLQDLKASIGKQDIRTQQSTNIFRIFESSYPRILRDFDDLRADIIYGDKTNPCEEALKQLGELLGLEASRPDKEHKTGPDVLWIDHESKSLLILEAKTDKSDPAKYRKKDVAQFDDHVRYVNAKFPGYEKFLVILGRNLDVTASCNPHPDLRIVNIEQFQRLCDIAKEIYKDTQTLGKSKSDCLVYDWLEFRGANWPRCITNMQSTLAIDLKEKPRD